MQIMLVGKYGQLAWELRRTLVPLGQLHSLSSKELNLEDKDAIRRVVQNTTPDVIVNAAAYTAVDQAEAEPQKASRINAVAPGILAEEARRLDALLVHFSTDYVFDGTQAKPYTEDDIPNPLNVYGSTKLEGEQRIRASGARHLILRICWIYGLRGKNFFLAMRELARHRNELQIVDDQRGAPNWSRLIAEATALLIASLQDKAGNSGGTYHLSSAGETTWYGFAREIFSSGQSIIPGVPRLQPVSTEQFGARAARPLNSVLDCTRLQKNFGIELPHWQEALKLLLEEARK